MFLTRASIYRNTKTALSLHARMVNIEGPFIPEDICFSLSPFFLVVFIAVDNVEVIALLGRNVYF